MVWEIKQLTKAEIKNPIIIEGLPGMGNVGKIAVDFMIDALNAKKILEFSSFDLPHCVFVNEENIVELPSINVYHKNVGEKTFLFLTGDIQPVSEKSCYEFCNVVLDTFQARKPVEIITLGGIALPKVPKEPKVYCTGNTKQAMTKYRSNLVNTQIYGVVGPIIGVSGLLPGLAGRRNIPAVALLAETFSHPNYVGIKGARNILKVLNKQLKLNLDIEELEKEIKNVEQEFAKKITKVQQQKKQEKNEKAPKQVMNFVQKEPEEENPNYFG